MNPKIAVIIPTKDRPLLFEFCIYTLKKFLIGNYDIFAYLYITNDEYSEYYNNIIKHYNIKCIKQSDKSQKELVPLYNYICKNYDYIITLTDDVVFYKLCNLKFFIDNIDDNVYSASFRLSKQLAKQQINNISFIGDNYYYYNSIIKYYNTIDVEGIISNFTYPFELTASLYPVKNFKVVLDNIQYCKKLHEIEYWGRRFVLDKFPDKKVLINEIASAMSIQWNGVVNDEKIISDNMLHELTILKNTISNFNVDFLSKINYIETVNDCFLNLTNSKLYIKEFIDCFENRK